MADALKATGKVQAKLWVAQALWAQVGLLLYLQLIEWVNLFPWNDIRHGNGQEGLDIALSLFMTVAIIGTYRRWRWCVFRGMAITVPR